MSDKRYDIPENYLNKIRGSQKSTFEYRDSLTTHDNSKLIAKMQEMKKAKEGK